MFIIFLQSLTYLQCSVYIYGPSFAVCFMCAHYRTVRHANIFCRDLSVRTAHASNNNTIYL